MGEGTVRDWASRRIRFDENRIKNAQVLKTFWAQGNPKTNQIEKKALWGGIRRNGSSRSQAQANGQENAEMRTTDTERAGDGKLCRTAGQRDPRSRNGSISRRIGQQCEGVGGEVQMGGLAREEAVNSILPAKFENKMEGNP